MSQIQLVTFVQAETPKSTGKLGAQQEESENVTESLRGYVAGESHRLSQGSVGTLAIFSQKANLCAITVDDVCGLCSQHWVQFAVAADWSLGQ